MRKLILTAVLFSTSLVSHAQNLSLDQKNADFKYLASLFSTYYAPLNWKIQLFNFDPMNIQPWMERVAQTKTDLDFYELCVAYVASLNDTHDHFTLPSDFVASTGFTVDVYDGVLLIDSINRTVLPAKDYPFAVGDQLLTVDGRDAQALTQDFAVYATYSANPIAMKRSAASRITSRPQSIMPHASDLQGKSAVVSIQRQSGAVETYTIPWVTSGQPLKVGPVPTPKAVRTGQSRAVRNYEPETPDYMKPLLDAQWSGVLDPEEYGLLNQGGRSPLFLNALPNANFTRRLGGGAADVFYSGTFKYQELTIGYIRIPSYSPTSIPAALAQFDQEIAFMKANTNGLIVDEMRNPGGSLCYGENIATRLIPYQFRATGFQLRPFWTRINTFYASWINAVASGASQQVIDQYAQLYQAMLTANLQGQLVTDSLPICSSSLTRDPILDADSRPIAYEKPILMLIDEFSTSTADSVAGMIRDADRAVLYGMRTNGAGGNNTSFDAGSYSEGVTGMTLALQTRKGKHLNTGYPYTELIENTGVPADFPSDYMTKDNLLQSGAPFLNGVLLHAAALIRTTP